jgi:integrase
MPKSLSEAKVRNSKPKSRPYKLSDGEGLFLLILPSGGKYWRMRYKFAGKEKLLAFGVYPEVSLEAARKRRAETKALLACGKDPGDAKKEEKRKIMLQRSNLFEHVAQEWFETRRHEWKPSSTRTKRVYLDNYLLRQLASKPVAEIKAPELLDMLRAIESRGTLDTARRVMQMCSQIFSFAVATGRAEYNPVPDLRGALKTPVVKHHSFLRADELPMYLKKLNSYDGSLLTKLALRLLLLTFVRTRELRGAEWKEIDWEKAQWRIPAERMKMKEEHIVPLAAQSVKVLRELEKISGHRQYLFPNEHSPSTFMSENTMLYALYRMGYHSRATGHGFRSTASTILNEHEFRGDVIERQLAHGERNRVRAAYNYAQYLTERREMMQWWADYLDEAARKGAAGREGSMPS